MKSGLCCGNCRHRRRRRLNGKSRHICLWLGRLVDDQGWCGAFDPKSNSAPQMFTPGREEVHRRLMAACRLTMPDSGKKSIRRLVRETRDLMVRAGIPPRRIDRFLAQVNRSRPDEVRELCIHWQTRL